MSAFARRRASGCCATSPLAAPGSEPLPRFFVDRLDAGSDLNTQPAASAAEAVRTLNAEGWWPTPLKGDQQSLSRPRAPAPGPGRLSHQAMSAIGATPRLTPPTGP